MTTIDYVLAFFTGAGFLAVACLIGVIVLIVRESVRDSRHLRARAREAAPALDEAIHLAVVQPQAHVYRLAEYRRNGGSAA